MMARTMIVFQCVGAIVSMIGTVLVLLWLLDVLITQWLRATGSFKILIRFAWLDGNKKQQLRDDIAEEERLRKIPYVPPVDDEDDQESLADIIQESSPTPAGSGSDSDTSPGAPSSQSRELGVEPRQGKGNDFPRESPK
jgi:hypothetical protein